MTTSSPIVNGQLDMSSYPPSPVLWCTAIMDTLCTPLACQDSWRNALGVTPDSWLSHKVPPLLQHMPSYPSFADFQQQQQQTSDSNLGQALYTYAFETSTTALGDLTSPTAIGVLVCLVLILRQVKAVFLPFFSSLGRWIGRATHGAEWEAQNEERIGKFGEYVFRLLYHSAISAYGIWYFWDKPWWEQGNTLSLYQGFPNHAVEPGMAWYYLLQAAYNVDAMVSLLVLSFTIQFNTTGQGFSPIRIQWSDTVRGDFREMFIHHIVTNLLVIGSSLCRLTRIGSMVFLIHDISDVPVDLSKLANFLKWKWTTLSCFLSMVAVWMVTRLYILPVVIYRSILTESHFVVEDGLPVLLYVHNRHFFYILVGLLILLHVAWFGMFLQIFSTFLRKSECHDLSEHKDGEKQHGSSKSQSTKEQPPSSAHTTIENKTNSKVSSASCESSGEVSEEKKDN